MDSWMILCLISSSEGFVLATTVTAINVIRIVKSLFTDSPTCVSGTAVTAEECALVQEPLHAAKCPRLVLTALETTHGSVDVGLWTKGGASHFAFVSQT